MNPIIRARVRKCLAAIASEVSRNVDNVNSGGCGVYAVELAKRMKKLGFTDMKLRVYGYPEEDERLVNVASVERKVFGNNPPDNIYDWNDNGVHFCHVRMEWGSRVWDVEGDESAKTDKVWNEVYPRHPGFISLKAMNRLSSKKAYWNPTFNRAQILLMRQIMDKHFAELHTFIEEQNNLPLAA